MEVGWRRERIDRPIKAQTDDMYALASRRNIAYLLLPRLLPPILLLVLTPLLPNAYLQRIVTTSAVFALLALSFGFLLQSVGLVSLGGALFFGCGAYTAGALNAYYGLPIYWTVPAGTFVGAALATGLLLPSLRMRGVYFALVSLTLPLLLARIIEATQIFGGTDGLFGLEDFPDPLGEIYLVLGVTLASLFLLRRLLATDFGLALRAIKDNDQAVRASGINVTAYKAFATFLAALPGAFAGAYVTHVYGFVGISAWSIEYSIFPIASAVVGGMAVLPGPVAGAFILTPLAEAFREIASAVTERSSNLRIAFFSMALIAFVLVWREGLVQFLARKYAQLERWVKV